MAYFPNYVFDPTATYPARLDVTLSGVSNSVILDTTSGTLSGLAVKGILYTALPAASTVATVSLSSFSGISFRVHTAYHGSVMAFHLFVNGSTNAYTLFTVNTATALQTTGVSSFDHRGPIERRKFVLND